LLGAKGTHPEERVIHYDLVCLSHVRWDLVFQRPQHLMSRCAHDRRVFYFEEPVIKPGPPRLEISYRPAGVEVAVPILPAGLSPPTAERIQAELLSDLVARRCHHRPVLWYQTPMAIGFTRHIAPRATVYDCMDELSSLLGAPPQLHARETELLARADLVFTSGHSLYEAKRAHHHNVHELPSSVDVEHFATARSGLLPEPRDQAHIRRPRIGYFGLIDERIDRALLASMAAARPDLHFIMVGPVVTIDPGSLPRSPNIHYLGAREYAELPAYIAGWDVAMIPFARNPATRFVNPTKTPEYLAAGRPVVSTSIRDVARSYGERGVCAIADTPEGFLRAIDGYFNEAAAVTRERRARADKLLASMSWNATWHRMHALLNESILARAEQTADGAPAVEAHAAG